LQVQLDDSDTFPLPLETTYLITPIPNGPPAGQILTPEDLNNLPGSVYEVFEPIAKTSRTLYQSHNEIRFYTWGDRECCLPAGATQATLMDGWRSPATAPPQPEPDPECNDDDMPDPPPWAGLERALHLKPGDILIFEEVMGARMGNPADADLRRRHAVCLTKVTPTIDLLQTVQDVASPPATPDSVEGSDPISGTGDETPSSGSPSSESPGNESPGNESVSSQGTGTTIEIINPDAVTTTETSIEIVNPDAVTTTAASSEFGDLPVPLVDIEWSRMDALPIAFCLSALGPAPDCELLTDITVARGNVLLVDHGRTLRNEDLGSVNARPEMAVCQAEGLPSPITPKPYPFRPQLQESPLTFRQPLPPQNTADCSATQLLLQDPRQALPQLMRLTSQLTAASPTASETSLNPLLEWIPVADLLASTASDRHVVAEIDDQGQAHLRFGNGEQGQMPAIGHQFTADYRIGNGPVGNVGAETIAYLVLDQAVSGIRLTPRNPLPAVGGTAPETLAEVKQFAPTAFRDTLQRAITAEDYGAIVKRDFPDQVQQAVAVLQWNGSWYEVLVAIDARDTGTPSAALLAKIEGHLHRFRRIGHDLRVAAAQIVPLQIEMTICVHPDYLRGQVKAAVLEKLSNRLLPNGQRGFFHPDNLTFGDRVSLSPLIALVQATAGVEGVKVKKFNRRYEDDDTALLQGFIPLGPLEIARLDNDPNQPEKGQLILQMGGGR
ncbi:MAG: putative baseplate assembly protein, partial [Leptolyngbya sp. SIO1D8]|nr:putative baseplate assembly protein [Leptolyngbya sp. SIO1D8]